MEGSSSPAQALPLVPPSLEVMLSPPAATVEDWSEKGASHRPPPRRPVVEVQELVACLRNGLVKRWTIRIRIRAASVYTTRAIRAAQKVVWPTA
jgi:hypothetical protein